MKKDFKVSGLYCGGCAASLKLELLDVNGIKDVAFDEGLKLMTVEGEDIINDDVKKAVEVCGFDYLGEA